MQRVWKETETALHTGFLLLTCASVYANGLSIERFIVVFRRFSASAAFSKGLNSHLSKLLSYSENIVSKDTIKAADLRILSQY